MKSLNSSFFGITKCSSLLFLYISNIGRKLVYVSYVYYNYEHINYGQIKSTYIASWRKCHKYIFTVFLIAQKQPSVHFNANSIQTPFNAIPFPAPFIAFSCFLYTKACSQIDTNPFKRPPLHHYIYGTHIPSGFFFLCCTTVI